MSQKDKPFLILMADDDPDDRLLAQDALSESRLESRLEFVEDGEELMAYLRLEGQYSDGAAPRPDLILLDLNMPRKDGREVIQEIKSTPGLRRIPIIVLTTSNAEEDICHSYDLGVNSFIVKPVSFEGLVDVMETVSRYWAEIVRLPAEEPGE